MRYILYKPLGINSNLQFSSNVIQNVKYVSIYFNICDTEQIRP